LLPGRRSGAWTPLHTWVGVFEWVFGIAVP
jgi:hypothetical protein